MRYYSLSISDPDTGAVWLPDPNGRGFTKTGAPGTPTFTSVVGVNSPQRAQQIGTLQLAGLQVEFDIPVFRYSNPQGGSIIRVWGISLQQISQASNLNFQAFSLSAGMQAGLPLANPKQAGVVARGMIFQAFGNWQGVNQTIDLIVAPGDLRPPGGIFFTWKPGQQLSTALAICFRQAFPKYAQSIHISQSLAQNQSTVPLNGTYESLSSFASMLVKNTRSLGMSVTGDENYPGVQISIDPTSSTIYVWDSTIPIGPTIQIEFQDLIGQPTWIEATKVSFKTVLRADIMPGDTIQFPQGLTAPYALTTQAAASPNVPASSRTAFQGTFQISEAHHFANFRQPDADSWATAYVATAIGSL
jgi:hypothetical protein